MRQILDNKVSAKRQVKARIQAEIKTYNLNTKRNGMKDVSSRL